MRTIRHAFVLCLLIGTSVAQSPRPATEQQDIRSYIKASWKTLSRSMNECSSIVDPKFGKKDKPVLYFPKGYDVPAAVAHMKTECGLDIRELPKKITGLGDVMPDQIPAHGLLYLPEHYVVPGGRFNEMYGWDSYFILRGLVEDGELDLAKGIVENFFFEIENYGAVLNANRTYYLTRSQPPFLTSMILSVYNAQKKAGKGDQEWLKRAYSYAKRDHELWMKDPKLAGDTGLSRYFDVGEGPVPDIADHPEYYESVANWLVKHPATKTDYLATAPSSGFGPVFRVPLCGKSPCQNAKQVQFTKDYYKGDRAMRESGFDISFRFGPFSGSTHHFAPVCLNSLLYKAEIDLSTMAHELGMNEEAQQWSSAAEERKAKINRLFWNEKLGMFMDYNTDDRTQSTYHYATTFYPLWVGIASPEQAKAVMRNVKVFERPGGIAMSDVETGVQWDLPYGWAPLQLISVEAMRRYGFTADADRVSQEFLGTVVENFRRDGTIREKYNVVTRSSEAAVTAGYKENIVGFGWTNGAFEVLWNALPANAQQQVLSKSVPAKAKAAAKGSTR